MTLLKDHTYVQKIKDIIVETKHEFAAFPYNRSSLQDIDDDNLVLTINDQSFFELLLLRIRGATIPYSSHKKKEKKNK